MSAEAEALHETHVCRDCGAEITLPYARDDRNLEGYWERAYWQVVPELLAMTRLPGDDITGQPTKVDPRDFPDPLRPPEPEPPDWDEADNMCPNCVTPWKCNGPHLADQTPYMRRLLASSRDRRGDWGCSVFALSLLLAVVVAGCSVAAGNATPRTAPDLPAQSGAPLTASVVGLPAWGKGTLGDAGNGTSWRQTDNGNAAANPVFDGPIDPPRLRSSWNGQDKAGPSHSGAASGAPQPPPQLAGGVSRDAANRIGEALG